MEHSNRLVHERKARTATPSAPWMMTRCQRRDMAKVLGVSPDYFEGMRLNQRPGASEKESLEVEAYLEVLMKVVAERIKSRA